MAHCTFAGCEGSLWAKGLCRKHHRLSKKDEKPQAQGAMFSYNETPGHPWFDKMLLGATELRRFYYWQLHEYAELRGIDMHAAAAEIIERFLADRTAAADGLAKAQAQRAEPWARNGDGDVIEEG